MNLPLASAIIKFVIIITVVHHSPETFDDMPFAGEYRCQEVRYMMTGWIDEHYPESFGKWNSRCEPDGQDI